MSRILANYLGKSVSVMLADEPYNMWPVEKSFEDDLDEPIIHYEFPQHGLELRCDQDGKISTIFLDSEELKSTEDSLLDALFASNRQQVVQRLGPPSKSGGPLNDSILGAFGAWDRFTRPGHAIHVEYGVHLDRASKITLSLG